MGVASGSNRKPVHEGVRLMNVICLRHGDLGSFAEKQLSDLRTNLLQAVNKGHSGPIVVDAHALTFAGASFLGVMAEAADELQSKGQRLLIIRASSQISELFRLAHLDALLERGA